MWSTSLTSSFAFCRNRAASILIIALGTMYYTWAKSAESAPPKQPVHPTDIEKAQNALARQAEGGDTSKN